MLPSEPPCSRTSLRRPRILLVDDDPAVIRGLWRVLKRQRPEYQVNTAAGAAQALEALSELSYDVVITDLQMPGGGGLAVLDALTQFYPETGRVLHSSQAESDAELQCHGAHVVLAKPASESEIVTAIEFAVERVASERKRACNG
jgi:CheY-like chemotaxis protein